MKPKTKNAKMGQPGQPKCHKPSKIKGFEWLSLLRQEGQPRTARQPRTASRTATPDDQRVQTRVAALGIRELGGRILGQPAEMLFRLRGWQYER